MLKILLPIFESYDHQRYDRVFGEIRKAGVPYNLVTSIDYENRIGELPARNLLFKMALQDPNWEYCVTLSNDIFELPSLWGKKFVEQMDSMQKDVGALNAYGFVNTFHIFGRNGEWAQYLIDTE